MNPLNEKSPKNYNNQSLEDMFNDGNDDHFDSNRNMNSGRYESVEKIRHAITSTAGNSRHHDAIFSFVLPLDMNLKS